MSRFRTPAWKPSDYESLADDMGGAFALARLMVLFLIIEVPLFILHQILWPLLRFVVLLPWTLARGLSSGEIRVEAISFFPWEESHLWITSKDHLARVIDQVAAGLMSGDVAHPLGADFRGSRQLVASTFRGLNRPD